MSCIFCKIVDRQIPAKELYRDDRAVAFADLNPQAPTHVLVIPTRHVASLAAATDADAEADTAMLGHLLAVCRTVAAQAGLTDSGFRVVTNIGADGGQSVHHLHFHVLGGRALHWPPG